MTINRKIQLSFLVMVLTGFASMGVVYYELIRLQKTQEALVDLSNPRKAAVYEMEINTIGMALAVLSNLGEADPQYLRRFEKDAGDFAYYYQQYRMLADTPRHKVLADNIAVLHKQFRALGWLLIEQKKQSKVLAVIRATDYRRLEAMFFPEQHTRRVVISPSFDFIQRKFLTDLPIKMGREVLGVDSIEAVKGVSMQLAQAVIPVEKAPQAQMMIKLTQSILWQTEAALALSKSMAVNAAQYIQQRNGLDNILDDEIQAETMQEHAQTLGTVQAALSRVLWWMVVVTLLFITIGCLCALMLMRLIARPAKELVKGADFIRHGNLGYRIQYRNADELGQVASHFNDMAVQLESTMVSKNVFADSEQKLKIANALLLQEIEMRKAAELTLQEQAYRDPLTGLYNRRVLQLRVQEEIARCQRTGDGLALLLCDLDHFKEINDTQGHDVGDSVLQTVSRVIVEAVRESDSVYRWGGDEFVVLISAGVIEMPQLMAERICSALEEVGRQLNLKLGVSIGVATFPAHGENLDDLIRIADHALYVAKHHRGTIHIGEEGYHRDNDTV